MNTGLARRLREGTWALHTTTERAGIMPALLRGQLPLATFVQLQRSLLCLYQALEAGLRQHAGHALLAPLLLAPLARCAALQDDVKDLAARLDTPADVALPATAIGYAAHLQALAAHRPALLAAHAYVRYLGDLAGGQALGRIARQTYSLPGAAGTRFFDFGPPPQVQALAQGLRSALDALPLDEAGTAALVAEAQWAFAQHARLFEELAAH
jgi:heme oxygenase